MSSEELDHTIHACLYGTRAPNGIHELSDVFWLMAWADWMIEKQLIEEASGFCAPAESQLPAVKSPASR